MKKLSVVIVLFLLALVSRAALPQPDLLLKVHFAGLQRISADPHAVAFTNEFGSSEASACRAEIATRLAGWLAGWLQTNYSAKVPDGAAQLRPLFDDLQASEFFLEARAAANNQTEVAMAIKLAPERAQLWQQSLKPFFTAATFKSNGGWLIFDSNPALLGLGDQLAGRIATPPAGWCDVDINWPQLAQWHPALKQLALPETQFNVTAPSNYFSINGKFYFPADVALSLEAWRIPTNSIRTPFDSFTAVRGFSSWLKGQPWAQDWQIMPVPNQLCSWSLPAAPMQSYLSLPVANVSDGLLKAYDWLRPMFEAANAANELSPAITPAITNGELNFMRMPWVAMKLEPLKDAGDQFLLGELSPNVKFKCKPVPAELYHRLETKGLVFYHYETPGVRIGQMLYLTQLGLAVTRHGQLGGDAPFAKWLKSLSANLAKNPARDHTDTEITQSGPAEFTFTRKSPVIFNALEFYALANWLESPDFPAFNKSISVVHKSAKHPNQPAFQLTPLPSNAPGH